MRLIPCSKVMLQPSLQPVSSSQAVLLLRLPEFFQPVVTLVLEPLRETLEYPSKVTGRVSTQVATVLMSSLVLLGVKAMR